MSSSLRTQDLSTLQKMQQWLKHPIAWSGIASVGVHGLLFALLPLINAEALKENPPDIQRSVDLVELTPEEQQRLPDFPGEAPIELPPLTQTPFQNSPLAPTLPPLNDPLPPTLPPSFSNPPSIFSIPFFSNVPPAPPPLSLPAPAPPTRDRPQTRPSPQPSASATPNPQQQNPQTSQSAEPPQPNESPTSENQLPAQQPSPQEQLLARNRELQELYTFNPEGTTQEAALQTDTGWLEQVSREFGDSWTEDVQKNIAPNQKPIEIAGAYPRAACLRRLSAAVVLGVVVDGEGKVVQDPVPPTIIQSSGYGVFNQLAIEAAAVHAFEATGKRLPYRVLVKFEPNDEVCPPGAGGQAPANPPA